MDTKRRHGENRVVKKSVRSTFNPKTGEESLRRHGVRKSVKYIFPLGLVMCSPSRGAPDVFLTPTWQE